MEPLESTPIETDGYEERLERGFLSDDERNLVIAKLAQGTTLADAAHELLFPLDLVYAAVGDAATADEIIALAQNAQRVEFVIHGTRVLLDIVKWNGPDKASVIAASRTLMDLLGMKSTRTGPGRPKKPTSRATVAGLEAAVRKAQAAVPS